MNAIALIDANWGIGYRGQPLFHIPEFERRLRNLTVARPIIVGRKTYNNYPFGSKLPGSRTIVMADYEVPDAPNIEVFHRVADLPIDKLDRAFVVGGGTVFTQLLPYCDTVFITKVMNKAGYADRGFITLDWEEDWKVHERSKIMEYKGLQYAHLTYIRKYGKHRALGY